MITRKPSPRSAFALIATSKLKKRTSASPVSRPARSSLALDAAALDAYAAPFLKEVALRKKLFSGPLEYDRYFTELKKYLCLCRLANDPVAMLSEGVDKLWHEFILFTFEYDAFCRKFLGKFIHHRPNTAFAPTLMPSAERFFSLYAERFGPLSEVWETTSTVGLRLHASQSPQLRLAGENCGGTDCGGNCDGVA